jgi:hypothetical protein
VKVDGKGLVIKTPALTVIYSIKKGHSGKVWLVP